MGTPSGSFLEILGSAQEPFDRGKISKIANGEGIPESQEIASRPRIDSQIAQVRFLWDPCGSPTGLPRASPGSNLAGEFAYEM